MVNQIETGYKPEFALGALYQGINAANAESANKEDLIRQFLANQRSIAQDPIETQRKEYELGPAQYDNALANFKRTDPNYIPAQIAGQIGQMQTQEAAGKTASALQPFRQSAEQAQLETEKNKQGVLWTIQDIDSKLAAGGGEDESGKVVPFTPMQRMFMQNKRAQLTDQLKSTPDFAGKKELADDKIEAMLEAARLRAQASIEAAEAKASQATQKAETEKQLYARALRIDKGLEPATEQQKLAAKAILAHMISDKVSAAAAANVPGLDLGKSGAPMAPPVAEAYQTRSEEATKAAQGSAPAAVGTLEWAKSAPKGTKHNGRTKMSDGPDGLWE
jgi:hypothetical protein